MSTQKQALGLNMRQNGKILDICSISLFQSILQAHFALKVCAQFQPYCNQSKPYLFSNHRTYTTFIIDLVQYSQRRDMVRC